MRYQLPHEIAPSTRALAVRIRRAFATGESINLKALKIRDLADLLCCLRQP